MWNRTGVGVVQPRTVLPWGAGSASGHGGGLSLCDSHLLSQYGAKALDRVLSTILSQTENRVPVPKSYDRGEAAFFQGKNIPSSGVSLCLAGSFSGLRCLKSRAERQREREQHHKCGAELEGEGAAQTLKCTSCFLPFQK